MRGLILVALLLALVTQPAIAQDETIEFEPDTGWEMEYKDASCVLKRTFSSASETAYLILESAAMSHRIQVLIASPDFEAEASEVFVRFFGDEGFSTRSNSVAGTMGSDVNALQFTSSLFGSGLSMSEEATNSASVVRLQDIQAREAQIDGFEVWGGFARPLRFLTGPMLAPMEAFRSCLADLRSGWGIELEETEFPVKPAQRKNFMQFVRTVIGRYPTEALRRGIDGEVNARILVGEDGRVAACRGQGQEILVEYACEMIERGLRYEPAEDVNGVAMQSLDSFAINFDI